MPTFEPAASLNEREARAAMVADMPGAEQPLEPADVQHAREIFPTNRVIDLRPVTRVDDNRYAIGPVSRALRDRLYEKVLAIFD